LCRWRDGEQAILDKDLELIVSDMEIGADFKNANPDSDDGSPLSGESILLRNMLLLYSVSLLHYWHATHDTGNLLQQEERDELEKRLGKVIAIDSNMPDPRIILGLIDYWFFNEGSKNEAVKMLEESQTTIPEIIRLITKEKANEELEHKKLDNFLAIVREYVNNNEIPQHIKLELLAKLERFSKFKDKGISITQERIDTDGATIASLQNRQAIMRKKMDRIVKSISAENKEKAKVLNSLMIDISDASKNIKAHAEKLESSEQELLVNTGEFLLRDEEVSGGTSVSGSLNNSNETSESPKQNNKR
jgi:hypothetical protein